MKWVTLWIVFLLMSGCTVMEHTGKVNRTLNHRVNELNQIGTEMARNYPLRQAQYATVRRNAGAGAEEKLEGLSASFHRMTEIKEAFRGRSEELASRTRGTQQQWAGKGRVTLIDPEWGALRDLKGHSASEYEALRELQAEYRAEEARFTRAFQSKDLQAYTGNLPRALWQARQVLKDLERLEAYDDYNESLLSKLRQEIETGSRDWETLATLARFEAVADNPHGRYGRAPSGYSGPSQATLRKATQWLTEVIDPHVVDSARSFVAEQEDVYQAAQNLQPLEQGGFSEIIPYISRSNLESVNRLFAQKREALLTEFLADKRRRVDAITREHPGKEARLKALIDYRQRFGKEHKWLVSEPSIKAFLGELRQQRLGLLDQIEPGITSSLRSADTLSGLKVSLSEWIIPEDQDSQVAKRIYGAQKERYNELTAFSPVSDSSQLSVGSFTAKGLNYEAELTAIYLGDFQNARLERDSAVISGILRGYLEAFGRVCPSELPSDRVPITKSVCAMERVTRDGWGNEVSRVCSDWKEIPTGLYADPELYAISNRVGVGNIPGLVNKVVSEGMFGGRSMIDDAISLGNDMGHLVRQNQCTNAGLERFEDNLFRFATGRRALLLPGGETLADVRSIFEKSYDVGQVDLEALLDDLIAENSKGWMMNRYRRGSVSNVQVEAVTEDRRPQVVSARYHFNSLGKTYYGDVTLTFGEDRPRCLYFSDAPDTCRHPSRRLVNAYEKGRYVN